MKTLQVRELPEHIYGKLADEASKEKRSLAQQAVAVLARGLKTDLAPLERRVALLKAWQDQPIRKNGKKIPSAVDLVREDRRR